MIGFNVQVARMTWTVFAIALLIYALYLIRQTVFIFILAILLAYMVYPLVIRIERYTPRRVPRTATVTIVFVLLIGILAGIYLAEYGQKGWLGSATRFINDILLSAPSIVIGLFIYAVVVARTGTFSGFAGVLALALIVIPVVIRTTENILSLIPNALREAAYALGTPKWRVVMTVTLKAARAGVITGILLAFARIAGETAPLLFTALSNQFWTSDLTKPMASLPVTIFKFAMSPYENWQKLAWAGVFLITLGVLLLNILARIFFRNRA